jgi:hypothetical protein
VVYCSFCAKSRKQVKKFIAGLGVCICDECVGLCVDILKQQSIEPEAPELSLRDPEIAKMIAELQANHGSTRFRRLFERIRERSEALLVVPELSSEATNLADAIKLDAATGAALTRHQEERVAALQAARQGGRD